MRVIVVRIHSAGALESTVWGSDHTRPTLSQARGGRILFPILLWSRVDGARSRSTLRAFVARARRCGIAFSYNLCQPNLKLSLKGFSTNKLRTIFLEPVSTARRFYMQGAIRVSTAQVTNTVNAVLMTFCGEV